MRKKVKKTDDESNFADLLKGVKGLQSMMNSLASKKGFFLKKEDIVSYEHPVGKRGIVAEILLPDEIGEILALLSETKEWVMKVEASPARHGRLLAFLMSIREMAWAAARVIAPDELIEIYEKPTNNGYHICSNKICAGNKLCNRPDDRVYLQVAQKTPELLDEKEKGGNFSGGIADLLQTLRNILE